MTNKRSLIAVVALGLAMVGCKKKDEKKPAANKAKPAAKTTATPSTATKKVTPTPATTDDNKATTDHITIEVSHAKPKPTDPVVLRFDAFKITKANFDPAKIVGGTAELEIDMASLDSGIGKRDKHLKSKDYFDIASFAKTTVKISDVKKGDGKSYTAKAEISIHGVSVSQAITFEVVSTTEDSIAIKAEHKLQRSTFKVGAAEGDSAADDVVIKAQLTVPKTPGAG